MFDRRSYKRRIDNWMKIGINPIKFREICWIHVLEDHEGVAVRRRQLDFGTRKNRIKVFGHPGIFLHTQHTIRLRNKHIMGSISVAVRNTIIPNGDNEACIIQSSTF